MKQQDYSQIIYDTYYSSNKLLKITLKNGIILEGKLTGFFHGDTESNEPFIIRWHFVGNGEEELDSIENGDSGAFLNQEDIMRVEFKEQ